MSTVTPPSALAALLWPRARLPEALALLAREARSPAQALPPVPGDAAGPEALSRWIAAAVDAVGLEAEPLEVTCAEAPMVLRGAGPALVSSDGEGWLVLTGPVSRGRCGLLDPQLRPARVDADVLAASLAAPLAAPHLAEIDRLLDEAATPRRRRAAARSQLLGLRLGARRVAVAHALRRPPHASTWSQLVEAAIPRRAALHAVAFAGALALDLAAWALIGRGALEGRLDWGWLSAWALVLATAVPVHALGTWLAGLVAIDLGGVLKRRLLAGALALEPEEVRRLGAGGHLSRVIESEEVESLGLGAAFQSVSGVLELCGALGLLGGALGPGALALAAAHAAGLALLAAAYHRARRAWTERRLDMTHALVERLVGHRTRLAQEPPHARHRDEDSALEGYLHASRGMDRWEVALQVLGGRGFLLVTLLALLPRFVFPDAATAPGVASPALALGVAAGLLGQRAWRRLTGAITAASGAALAWSHASALYRAAARRERAGAAALAGVTTSSDAPVLEARGVGFRHAGRTEEVLRGAQLQLQRGERLLLEGPSGSGKSTLASILTGLRAPSSGLCLLGGVDHKTLGATEWRRRVASAPQFHENHVLTGTLAYNLLMGRAWPPTQADVDEAEALLRALRLGPLLERMPAGMQQVVGETGWQLSHGEKSRVYLARALLQRADLVVLDETFGALDPETMREALRVTFERTPALIVIAHP